MSVYTSDTPVLADIVANRTMAKYEIPLVFLQESALYGTRTPTEKEWLTHIEMYKAIGRKIDATHLKGLQRIRGLWRIYLDNIQDKVTLLTHGVPLRNKVVPVLSTNPNRLDGEDTTKVRVKNLPLSVDDGVITRALTLLGIEVISHFREKLRVDQKLTNCETGDRIVIVKSSTLSAPLPSFMSFGKYSGRVIHYGQKPDTRTKKCSKCLQEGHMFASCPNDWVCSDCNKSGHKRSECPGTDPDASQDEPGFGNDETVTEDGDESSPAADQETVTTASGGSQQTKNQVTADASQKTTMSMVSGLLQSSIDSFLTPNKDRQKNVTERSPPTPPEALRDKQSDQNVDTNAKKHKKK